MQDIIDILLKLHSSYLVLCAVAEACVFNTACVAKDVLRKNWRLIFLVFITALVQDRGNMDTTAPLRRMITLGFVLLVILVALVAIIWLGDQDPTSGRKEKSEEIMQEIAHPKGEPQRFAFLIFSLLVVLFNDYFSCVACSRVIVVSPCANLIKGKCP